MLSDTLEHDLDCNAVSYSMLEPGDCSCYVAEVAALEAELRECEEVKGGLFLEVVALEARVQRLTEALAPFAALVAGSDEHHDWLPHPNEVVCAWGDRFLLGQALIQALESLDGS